MRPARSHSQSEQLDAGADAAIAPPQRFGRSDAPALVVIAATVLLGWLLGGRLWFYADDWNIIAGYHDGRLLEPYNSHLSLVPAGIYQVLFHTFGLGSFAPYRVVGLIAYAFLGLVCLRYLRTRLNSVGAAVAVAAILWNAGASTSLMFPFLMNYSLPIAAIAGIWWHFDRGSTRDDLWASGWLVFALASSGMGLLCVVAVAVELLLSRASIRRWLLLAPGPALWFAWYLRYGEKSPPLQGLGRVMSDTAQLVWGGFASLVGGNKAFALVLIVGFLATLVSAIRMGPSVYPRVIAGTATILAFAVLTAISFNRPHAVIRIDEPRYRWTIGVLLVLTCVTLVPRLSSAVAGRWNVSRRWLTAALAVCVAAVTIDAAITIRDSRRWTDSVAAAAPGIRDNLAATEEASAAGVLDSSRVSAAVVQPCDRRGVHGRGALHRQPDRRRGRCKVRWQRVLAASRRPNPRRGLRVRTEAGRGRSLRGRQLVERNPGGERQTREYHCA